MSALKESSASLIDVLRESSCVSTFWLKTLNEEFTSLNLLSTYSFKDIALQFLGNLFEYILTKNGQKLNILGANIKRVGE